jgi:hypothetical protein
MSMRGGVHRIALYVLLFITGFSGIRFLRPTPDPAEVAVSRPGSELVLVLLVDTECGWSNDPALRQAWARLVSGTRRVLPDSIDAIYTIGVASGASTQSAASLLGKIGTFDEAVLGGRLNSGALRYMSTDFRGPNSTPQVVVAYRQFATMEDGSVIRQSEAVVRRITGLMSIEEAAERVGDVSSQR